MKLPRYWKRMIAELTGLLYCDRDCYCGENNNLWWDHGGSEDWVPSWMNGGDTHEIWQWLVENGKVPAKTKQKKRLSVR